MQKYMYVRYDKNKKKKTGVGKAKSIGSLRFKKQVSGIAEWTYGPVGGGLDVMNASSSGNTKFDAETSAILEAAFQRTPDQVLYLTHGAYGNSPGGYAIDFSTMTQLQMATGIVRPIKRKGKF